MFINTAIVNLVVNANFQDLEFVKYLPFEEYLFNADYSDFDRDWYIKVGSTFVATMLISIASPHLLHVLIFHPLGKLKRKCCWKRYKT